jgi:hypothetical protein
MFLKNFILLVLATLAFAYPQDDIKVDHPDVDVSAIENRVEFITNYHHEPTNCKEGDLITITYDPPTDENARNLVSYFTIAIGTGTGTMVDNDFFMESDPIQIPNGKAEYKIQLPAQMEGKQYCIVYTPYAADGTKPVASNGDPMESLYETWFAIEGSLAEGTGEPSFKNTYDNSAPAQSAQTEATSATSANQGNAATTEREAQNANNSNAAAAVNVNSGSITISPAITAFIAILFACFFI